MNQSDIQASLRKGIALARAGQAQEATRALSQVIKADPTNVSAWLWLSTVVSDPAKKMACLRQVLKLEPGNRSAQMGLDRLKQQTPPVKPQPDRAADEPGQPSRTAADSAPSNVEPASPEPGQTKQPGHRKLKKLAPAEPPTPEATASRPSHIAESASLASTLLKDSFAARRPPPEPIEDAPEDSFGDEYLCPYCAAQTQPNDSRCKKCSHELWVTLPKRAKPSRLYRIIRLLHTISFILDMALLGILLLGATMDGATPVSFTISIFGCLFPVFLIRVAALIGLYRRWRIIYYLFLLNAILVLGYAGVAVYSLGYLYGLASIPTIGCGGGLAFVAIALFLVTLNLGEDFTFNKYRILLKVDPDVKTGLNLLDRGRYYAERKMWAKAAVHFRRAAYQLSSDAEAQLSLAVAYINLKMYDQAQEPVQKAKKLDPLNPKIENLETLLATQQNRAAG